MIEHDKYLKLEKKIKSKSFHAAYSGINKWAFAFSILGNLASIFFAYFLLFSLLKESMPSITNTIGLSIGVVVFLAMFEMLKRYVFGKFSLEHVKSKFKLIKKEVLILTMFSLLLISGSFFLSLNGAKKFSDQLEHIEESNNNEYLIFQDSINAKYDDKILVYDDKNKMLKDEIYVLTNENIKINEEAEEINSFSTKKAKYKLIEQNNDRISKNLDKIDSNDDKIDVLEDKRDVILLDKKTILEKDAGIAITKGNTNSVKFLIISTFIEFIILLGVYFNVFYDFRSIEEYEENMKYNPNFDKWKNYNSLLDLIYNNGTTLTRVGENVMLTKSLISLARINNNHKLDKNTISDAFKVFNHLGVITSKGSKRIVEIDYEIAQEVLKDYFNIK